MKLNIYYSKNFLQKNEYKKFFIDNFLFKERKDYLAGELIDVFFYDINDYKIDDGFDIILVDEYLINEICNSDINEKFERKWESSEYKNIIFISLSKNYNKLKISDKVNFIQLYKIADNLDEMFDFIYTEITHDILRFLLKKERLNIFISHAKKDGVLIAKEIKSFIDSRLKLSNFFDKVNISNSERWDEKLEKSVKNSDLFIYILSDNYAQTFWTKKELILAKEEKKVIIGIDILSNKTEVTPYIANTKIFKLLQNIQKIEMNCIDTFLLHTKHNIRAIINFLLREALIYKLGEQKGINLPRKPDLFDLCKSKETIIYPDPPLMNIEEESLKRCTNNEFFTPLTKNMKNINKKIAISISEPDDLEEKGMKIEHLRLLMIEIARYLIIRNATLIYGGDLGYKKEKFNFTALLADTFKAYNRVNEKKQKKLINYSAYPFCKRIDVKTINDYSDVIEFKECIGKDCSFSDIEIIANNLTKMRQIITKEMDLKIAVGGKISGFSGFYPGVLEEVYLALKANKPVVLIKGFGGIVDKIIDFIEEKEVEELSFEYQIRVNLKLDRFLKDSGLSDEVKSYYGEMLRVIRKNKDIIKIIKFKGFEKFINKLIDFI